VDDEEHVRLTGRNAVRRPPVVAGADESISQPKGSTMKKTVLATKNETWNSERDQLIGRLIRISEFRPAQVTELLGLNVTWDTNPESDSVAWETFITWTNLLALARIPFAYGPVANSIVFALPRTSAREDEEIILIFPADQKVGPQLKTKNLEQRVAELERITLTMAAILVNDGRASWADVPTGAEQGPFIMREQGFDFEKLQVELDDIFRKFTR